MSDKTVPMLQTYRSIIITTQTGDKYEITSAVAEMNIYEDIFSNILTGDLLYVDDHGALSDLQCSGNEKLTIELYVSPDNDNVTTYEFFVYGISNATRTNSGTGMFIMHFTSFEAEINKNSRCYAAMTGSNSQNVEKLFAYLGSPKKLSVEPTVGVYKFVMPSKTPLECINWYAGRSVSSESNGSYYLFYETVKEGFRFDCVDTLVEKDAVGKYRFEPAGTSFYAKDLYNIREYNVVQVANTLDGFDEHYTTLWTTDLTRKKIVKSVFDYDKDKKSSLNQGASLTSSNKKNGFDADMAERREIAGTRVVLTNETRSTHTQTRTYYYDSTQPKLSAIRQYAGLKLRLLVFGNRSLQVGKTIDIDILKTRAFDSESKDQSRDEMLSGKYLITAIRYIYKINDFEMSVEVVKDTRA
jgi:hypothetical protein